MSKTGGFWGQIGGIRAGLFLLSIGTKSLRPPASTETTGEAPQLMAARDNETIAKAKARSVKLRKRLIAEAGGLLSSKKTAALLGISSEALEEITKGRRLIAVKQAGGALGYPAFQFESKNMLSGIPAVLEVIGVDDPWARLNFMFLELEELDGRRPVDAIRAGNAPAAAKAARHYGDHGAS